MTILESKKSIALFTGILALLLISLSFTASADDGYDPEEGWKIPPPVKKIKNPLEADKSNLMKGKVFYEKHCASCHGDDGAGDGTKTADLDSDPGDFTAKAFHDLPDGTIFFMTKEGKDEMKSFKKKLDDKQIWQIITYMRTLE